MQVELQEHYAEIGMWHKMFRLSFAAVCVCALAAPLLAQKYPASQVVRTEIRHFGTAEARVLTHNSGFYPNRQPAIYWHGEKWKINLLPLSAPNAAFQLKVTSSDGREKIVTLPARLAQIDSIYQAPNDKAIVIAELGWMAAAFCIVDLESGKVMDHVGVYNPVVSPNRRFILFDNWYPPHTGGENVYRLYDVMKSPRENTCWFRSQRHENIDEGVRGFQVYPQGPDRKGCAAPENEDDDNVGFDFAWAADSSKVVFADIKNGAIRLIMVTMPGKENWHDVIDHDGSGRRRHSLPQTSTYTFTGVEDICAGASSCTYNNVHSVAWSGDSVAVVLMRANPGGKAIEKDVTIPVSEFVPIGSRNSSGER